MENISSAQVAQNQVAAPQTVATSAQSESMQPATSPLGGKIVKKRRSDKPSLTRTLAKAKKLFLQQLDKTNELKLRCLERAIGADTQDRERFWLHYRDLVDALLDSRRFGKECSEKELKPSIVAEHIVFEGVTTMRRVLRSGITSIGNEIELFKEGFTNNLKGSTSNSAPAAAIEATPTTKDEPAS